MTRILLALAALAAGAGLAACDQTKSRTAEAGGIAGLKAQVGHYSDALSKRANVLFGDTLEKRAGAAGDRAENRARDTLSSGSYDQAVGDSDCTQDCAGHDAGFAWARSRKIENPDGCPSDRGEAYEEGCRAYGEAIQGARDEARSAVLNGKDPPT